MPKRTGLEVDGLSEAMRAMSRLDRDVGNEARDLVRAGAKRIQADAQRRVGRRPGGGSYPRRSGMIGRTANNKGGGIVLKGGRYPWAWGAEFGARRAWVFGMTKTQGSIRRRQFPVWRGNQFVVRGLSGPGWIIQPAIRENLDPVLDEIADGMQALINKLLNQAGVPR